MDASSSDPLRVTVDVKDVALLIRLAEQYGIQNYDLIVQLYLHIGKEILSQHAKGMRIILRDPSAKQGVYLNVDSLIDGVRIEDIMRPVRDQDKN